MYTSGDIGSAQVLGVADLRSEKALYQDKSHFLGRRINRPDCQKGCNKAERNWVINKTSLHIHTNKCRESNYPSLICNECKPDSLVSDNDKIF